MKIQKIKDENCQLTVIIHYPKLNRQVNKIINVLEGIDMQILVKDEEKEREIILDIYDIYYLESVEKKTYIYTCDKVYRCSKKMTVLKNELNSYGFIQINKTCLINMEKLESVKTLWNSRLEATLINKEKVIITRTYIPQVREWLNTEVV